MHTNFRSVYAVLPVFKTPAVDPNAQHKQTKKDADRPAKVACGSMRVTTFKLSADNDYFGSDR